MDLPPSLAEFMSLIGDSLGVDGAMVHPQARLVEDLGMDARQRLKIGARLGNPLVQPDPELLTGAVTVGELHSLLHAPVADGTPQLSALATEGLQAGPLSLRPITSEILPSLYRLYTTGETGYRWSWKGEVVSREVFDAELSQGILSQFAVLANTEVVVGHVSLYNVDFRTASGYFLEAFRADLVRTQLATAASTLFLRYAVGRWNLRKIYLEIAGYDYVPRQDQGLPFEVEARLHEHEFFAGRFWDRYILGSASKDLQMSDASLESQSGRSADIAATPPPDTPDAVASLVLEFVEAWNADNNEIRGLLGECCSTNIEYCDPTQHARGREALAHAIQLVRAAYPRHILRRSSPTQIHHNVFRYSWRLASDQGSTSLFGITIGKVSSALICDLAVFVGDLPPLTLSIPSSGSTLSPPSKW